MKIIITALTTLIAPKLIALLLAELGKQVSGQYWFIKIFDSTAGKFLRDRVWSGQWSLTWHTDSANFPKQNTSLGTLHRCFNSIALKSSIQSSKGSELTYLFVGKLSRDRTILTGTWYDDLGSNRGYHGSFQIRLDQHQKSASGKWIGFSDSSNEIRSDNIIWNKKVE